MIATEKKKKNHAQVTKWNIIVFLEFYNFNQGGN